MRHRITLLLLVAAGCGSESYVYMAGFNNVTHTFRVCNQGEVDWQDYKTEARYRCGKSLAPRLLGCSDSSPENRTYYTQRMVIFVAHQTCCDYDCIPPDATPPAKPVTFIP